MTTPRGKEWFVIRVQPRKEQLAGLNYDNQGYVVYLPLMRAIRHHARRREEVLRPVFPGYLFLHLAPEERNWTAIGSTRGAIGPVRFGDLYIPVPDWVVDSLKNREDDTGTVPLGHHERIHLAPGAAVNVQVSGGIAAGGVFCSFKGKDNVVVLLDLLQRQVKTTLHISQVRPAT